MSRKKPFTPYERQLVKQLVGENLHIVESHNSDNESCIRKAMAWQEIGDQFNDSKNISHPATVKQLRKLWQNLKDRARGSRGTRGDRTKDCDDLDMDSLESRALITPADILFDSDVIPDPLIINTDGECHWQAKRKCIDTNSNLTPVQCKTERLVIDTPEHSRPTDMSTGKVKTDGSQVEALRYKILKQEMKNNTVRFQFEMKTLKELLEIDKEERRKKLEIFLENEREKHTLEMEILHLKRDILIKQLKK